MIPTSLTVYSTKSFRKDFERWIRKYPKIRTELETVVDLLVRRFSLPPEYEDHPLKGNLKGFRDCHVRGDLVLIYRIVDEATLRLERLGTHSDLNL